MSTATLPDAPVVDVIELDDAPVTISDPPQRRDGLMVFLFLFAGLALLTSVVAVGYGMRAVDESKRNAGAPAAGAGAAAPSTVTVYLSEFKIEPRDVTVAAGGTLRVMNSVGAVSHDLAVKTTALHTPMIPAGGTGELALGDLPPGTYTLFCNVGGHEVAGMTATMHVVGSAGAAPAPAAPGAQPAQHHMSADEMDAMMATSVKAFPQKTQGLGAQPLAPTLLADGTKQFDLTTKIVKWEVEAGRTVDAWTYNGTVPGPTLRVEPGDKVRVVVRNDLLESTAVHFHGLRTPNAQDGVPDITQTPIKPGTTYRYEFTAQSTPTVGMYHSHQNAVVQVPNGLAGAFIVGHEPLPAGVTVAQEHVMMLNDSGTIGFSLNGKSFPATAPVVAKKGEWIQVQYMNEGEMVHPMHLAQLVIAKDGYPTPQPYNADTILVGPGERYTVLVKADVTGTWAWHCHILSHAESEKGMFGMVTALVVQP
jgi:manganese oxidase